jgi:hypothetical protein
MGFSVLLLRRPSYFCPGPSGAGVDVPDPVAFAGGGAGAVLGCGGTGSIVAGGRGGAPGVGVRGGTCAGEGGTGGLAGTRGVSGGVAGIPGGRLESDPVPGGQGTVPVAFWAVSGAAVVGPGLGGLVPFEFRGRLALRGFDEFSGVVAWFNGTHGRALGAFCCGASAGGVGVCAMGVWLVTIAAATAKALAVIIRLMFT